MSSKQVHGFGKERSRADGRDRGEEETLETGGARMEKSAFILRFDRPPESGVAGDETKTQSSLRFDRMTVNE